MLLIILINTLHATHFHFCDMLVARARALLSVVDFLIFIIARQDNNAVRLSATTSVCHVPVLYINGLTHRHTFFRTW